MDDFDPAAYLASKKKPSGGDFDPAAYLAAKKGGKPTAMPQMHRLAEDLATQDAMRVQSHPKDERSFLEKAADSVVEGLGTIKRGAVAVGHGIAHPVDTMTDAPKRRQFLRGVDDMVTLGAGQNVAGVAGDAMGDSPAESLVATEDTDQMFAPDERVGGNILGGAFGLSGYAGKTAATAAKRILPTAAGAGRAVGAATGAARGALAYQGAVTPVAAVQAVNRGDDPVEAASEAATDPLGLILGGATGAVGGGAEGYRNQLRDPKNLSGRVLRDVDAAGGTIQTRGEPVVGGDYALPELTDLPHGRQGVNKLAGDSARRVVADTEAKYAAAQEAWGNTADAVLAEHGDRHYLADATHGALDALDSDNVINGVVADEKIARAVDKARRMLTTDTGILDRAASDETGTPVYIHADAGTVSDFMRARKALNQVYRHTVEPAEKHAFGVILEAMKEDAAQIDPRIGELNRQYAQTVEGLKASNDALFGQQRPVIKDTESALQQGAGRLGRLGDETQAGTLAQERMGRFAAASPENAREVRLNRAKKAAERLRYGNHGEVSTSMEKGRHEAGGHLASKALMSLLGHGLMGPVGAVAGAVAPQMFGNPLALKLRLGLPAAEAMGGLMGTRPALLTARPRQLEEQRGQ